MPRNRRKESSTGIYHVIAKGINKELIFNQNREKIYLLRTLSEVLIQYNVEIYAYCIMSNHIHLIIKSELQELSMFMAKCLAKYAEYYNYKHKRNGHVFQNRFRSECIETEKYFWNCLRYIHLNPVKKGCVKTYLNYKYSSICEYRNKDIKLLHENALSLFSMKFDDWEDFINFHNKRQYNVFIDTNEEVKKQQIEIAIGYLYQMQQEYKFDCVERIIEERVTREKFKEYLCEQMQISMRASGRIFSEIKNKYIK